VAKLAGIVYGSMRGNDGRNGAYGIMRVRVVVMSAKSVAT